MTNPASTTDLQDRFYRDLTTREQAITQTLLDDAYDLLIGRRPTLDADVTAGTVRERTVIRVLCDMVGRVLSNPEGKVQEALDDYSYRRSDLVASGVMAVTDDELADISPGRRTRRSVRLSIYGEPSA